MIIHRAFYREAALVTLGITAVLLVIVVFQGLSVFLGRAAMGEESKDVVMTLLGLQTLRKLDLLLPLALYFGTLLTLSRWYRDSEMTVLAACGVGLTQLLRPVMVFALAVAAVVTLGSFFFTPYASRQTDVVKNESGRTPDVGRMTPGVFTEAQSGKRIFYAARMDQAGDMEDVFMSQLEAGKRAVVVARTGHPFIDEKTGDKFLALRDGRVYNGEPGEAKYQVLRFETFNVRLEPKRLEEPPSTVEGLGNRELLARGDGPAIAEWHWRIGKPIAVFVLALYALVLAHTDARRGRLSNLFAAILVYLIYSNLLGLGQTLLKKGQISPLVGLWWLHIGMALVAIYLLHQRASNRPLIPLPRWRR